MCKDLRQAVTGLRKIVTLYSRNAVGTLCMGQRLKGGTSGGIFLPECIGNAQTDKVRRLLNRTSYWHDKAQCHTYEAPINTDSVPAFKDDVVVVLRRFHHVSGFAVATGNNQDVVVGAGATTEKRPINRRRRQDSGGQSLLRGDRRISH